ncbi:MAG: response regulator [Mariprofundaceae bacterium]
MSSARVANMDDTLETDILIVEDDTAIARLMEIHLQKSGFTVSGCDNGNKAIEQLQQHPYKLLILDRMIPGKRGLDVLRWLRKRPETSALPVLMVTALASTEERVHGLNEGADDYLPKPFEPDELIARVRALLRQNQRQTHGNPQPEGSPLKLDVNSMELQVSGEMVPLRPLEFRLLQTLMEKPGKVRSREHLLDKVWGISNFVEIRTVDVTIKRLRKVLAEHELEDVIQTVRSAGYRFLLPKERK